MATVHDLLRLRHPEHCYGDDAFIGKFGNGAFAALREATAALRDTAPWPANARNPESWHEEFYGRMVAHSVLTSAATIVPTKVVASHVKDAFGAASPSPAIIPWGADHFISAKRDARASARSGFLSGPYIVYLGQARAHKGLDTLHEAFMRSRFRKAGGSLVLIGRDFAPAVNLEEQTLALGEVSDAKLASTLRQAEAAVHLAEHEGFGFPPLEALSVGTRVLASDIPVLRETLGAYASFTDPHDPVRASEDLDRLIDSSDPPGARADRIAHAVGYSWERCARKVLAMYAAVAS
ncbi:glycosyltransferase [Myceligenerans halotolerans]